MPRVSSCMCHICIYFPRFSCLPNRVITRITQVGVCDSGFYIMTTLWHGHTFPFVKGSTGYASNAEFLCLFWCNLKKLLKENIRVGSDHQCAHVTSQSCEIPSLLRSRHLRYRCGIHYQYVRWYYWSYIFINVCSVGAPILDATHCICDQFGLYFAY